MRKHVRLLAVLATLAGLTVVTAAGIPLVSVLAAALLAAAVVALLLWGAFRLSRKLLWRVGRRLAFSYFLIGLVPVPLLALLATAAGYLVGGFLLGHLFHDAAGALQADLTRHAEVALAAGARGAVPDAAPEGVARAVYLHGRRVSGDPSLPNLWPAWATAAERAGAYADAHTGADTAAVRFFAGRDGRPTLAAVAGERGLGALAVFTGDVEALLSRASGVWIELYRPDEGTGRKPLQIQIGDVAFNLRSTRSSERVAAAEAFFRRDLPAAAGGALPWLDRPMLWWSESPGPLADLATGQPVASTTGVRLNGSVRAVKRHVFSSSADFDAKVWGALFAFAFLLFDVYAVAAAMAAVMIFALSRAVNRLSHATDAVRQGDFGVRIPVRRHDQVGELQTSFNAMAAHLQTLVATATEKELLEKELSIARDLQRSLLPRDLPAGEAAEFALFFAPSAAIGGDYFDVFTLAEGRLAVVIADVSGHGLPSGLRMAMLKAALTILVGEGKPPAEIFARLDETVRSGGEHRLFVTATLALVDLFAGTVELTNAGHPPTYHLHQGQVTELALPGSPLGGLDRRYGRGELALAPGDLVVWLSDGLIEATDAAGDAFGYDAVARALAGPGPTAAVVRDRLLAAVDAHTGGRAVDDDRTMVVLRYLGRPAGAAANFDGSARSGT